MDYSPAKPENTSTKTMAWVRNLHGLQAIEITTTIMDPRFIDMYLGITPAKSIPKDKVFWTMLI